MEEEAAKEDELEDVPFLRRKDGNPLDDASNSHEQNGLDPTGLCTAGASNHAETCYTVNGQQTILIDHSNLNDHAETEAYRFGTHFNGTRSNGTNSTDTTSTSDNGCCEVSGQQAREMNHSDITNQEESEMYRFGHGYEAVSLAEPEIVDQQDDMTKGSDEEDETKALRTENEQLQSSQDYIFLFECLHTKMSESYIQSHPMNTALTSSTCEDAMSFLLMKRSINEPIETLNYFEFLPTELILLIFSYLLTHELCRHVLPVCRQWRQIAMDQTLWKSIDFTSFKHLNSLNLLWVVRQAPHLQKLVIRARHNITMAEIAIITEFCPSIQDIDLGFCDALNCDMIQCLVKNCPKLTKINVEGCEKIDSKCIRLLSKRRGMSHFNFSHCAILDSSLKFLCNNIQRLISINLDGIPFTTDSVIVQMVSKHGNWLQELELDGAEISDESLKYLSKCSQLKHLSVSFCECLTDQGLLYLKNLKNLKVLRLRKGTDFSVQGLIAFFHEASLSQLHSLNFSECSEISDAVVLEMVKSCGRHLRQLDLQWCWSITERGLISIVDHCSNLRVLDLLGIDKITGECLARVPEEMPYLRFLDLQQCNTIVDSLICDVVCRKPDLQVLNYYGEKFVHSDAQVISL